MTNQEIRETLREMLVHWNVCMEIAMRDTGASEEEAKEIVGKLFEVVTKSK